MAQNKSQISHTVDVFSPKAPTNDALLEQEPQLHNTNATLIENLVDVLAQGVLEIRLDFSEWYIQAVNPVGLTWLGYDEAILDQPLEYICDISILKPKEWDKSEAAPIAIESVMFYHKMGQTLWAKVTILPTPTKNHKLLILEDINNKLKVEQELSRIYNEDRLMMLSHGLGYKLQDPLAIILANNTYLHEQLLELKQLSPEIEELIEAVCDTSTATRKAIALLKQTAQTTNHAMKLTNFNALLNETIRSVLHRSPLTLNITQKIEPDISCYCDPGQLTQAILGMIHHAQGVAPDPKTQTIHIEAKSKNRHIYMEARYECFPKTEHDTSLMDRNLLVCQTAIDAHQGELLIVSEGNIEQMSIKLPQLSTGQTSEPIDETDNKANVLFIDDELQIQRSISRILNPLYNMTTVSTAEQALMHLAQNNPTDAIICDIILPGTNGLEFFNELKVKYPEQCATFSFCSGELSLKIVRAIIEDSVVPVLQKPFCNEQLKQHLELILN